MAASGHQIYFQKSNLTGAATCRVTRLAFFNDYFTVVGAKEDKRVNFHSFRHGATDAFRRGGYLDEQFACLIGHTKATTTGRYGIMPEGALSQRVAMIEAMMYPGLDLSHLEKSS